jgi:hypothetical protein
MRRVTAWSLAALLASGAARAQDSSGRAQDASGQQQQAPQPRSTPPLSQEDAELVKELAVLEQMELLKNLELFEKEKEGPRTEPQGQP